MNQLTLVKPLKDRLRDFLKEKSISQKNMAKAINRSDSVISQYLGSKGYVGGDIESLERDIESYLALQENKEKLQKFETKFVQISSAKSIFGILSRTHSINGITVIYGEAGYGKTTAVKAYTKHHVGVVLIEADINYSNRELFRDLHEKLGYDGQGTTPTMKRDILRKLKDSGRLLIVDEAEHMSVTALDSLRRLHDLCDGTISIVLVGLPQLLNNIIGRKKQFAQLFSRLDLVLEVKHLAQADVDQLVNESMPDCVGYTTQLLKLSGGRVRSLTKILAETRRLATYLDLPVSEKIINEAYKGLKVLS